MSKGSRQRPTNIPMDQADANFESIFGKRIEKSGSIIRGFSVGSNKDLTLQSGFRLQLAGKLSDDVIPVPVPTGI